MLASQPLTYRHGMQRVDPLTRTMRIVHSRSRRFWFVPHLALAAFIAAMWASDLIVHLTLGL
jgi:hypothetical protein